MKIIVAAAFLVLMTAVNTEAVPMLQVHICQGGTCVDFGPAPGPGPFVNNNVLIGDFAISGSVSSIENPLLSNAATTTISVQRVSTANDAQGDTLDIWLSASNYNLPVITNGYTFRTAASFTSSEGPTDVPVSFQGWLSAGNVVGFPPAGLTPGNATCLLDAGTDACSTTTGVISSLVGTNPFTMTTRTSFTISDASAIASYTSNAQANITPAAIPEPTSLILFGTGIAYLARRRAKKKLPIVIA